MAIKFKYAQKLNELEEFAESRAAGRFSGIWLIVLAILRSRYLLISLCFYLLLLMVFGGIVVSKYVITKGTFEEGAVLMLPSGPRGPPPSAPRAQPSAQQTAKATREVSVSVQPMAKAARSTAAQRFTISEPSAFVRAPAPVVAPMVQAADVKVETAMARNIEAANIARLQAVREFQKGWNVSMGGGSGRSSSSAGGGAGSRSVGGSSGAGRGGKYSRLQAEFSIFQAKYQDGDWYCNGGRTTNLTEQSSLKNFMFQMRQWSDNRVKASIVPKILDIGTEELFTLNPPFVYLTGHKDFHFLLKEVKNLQDYLLKGGCIWADSALAGRRSRFDIAFRREIKRVVPDREFEILTDDHELYDTRFKLDGLPAGMNFYKEQVEIINIGDELAVIYTLNGYGHFWESRLNREGKIEEGRINLGVRGQPSWQWVYGYSHRYHPRQESGVLFRNLSNESVAEAYRFGINVVYHLLVRYEDKLRFVPKELPKIDMHRAVKKEDKEPDPYATFGEEKTEKPKPARVHKKMGSAGATNAPDDKGKSK